MMLEEIEKDPPFRPKATIALSTIEPGQEPFTGAGYLAVELLNQVGDINLGIHDFVEFASVAALQELKL